LLLLVAAVYHPGLSGAFIFDDFPSIVANGTLRFDSGDLSAWRQAMFSGIAGWGGRPVAMLSFAVDAALHGMDPYWFKLSNLFIHLGNILLVFTLTQRVLFLARPVMVAPRAQCFVSLAVAACWGLHPLQLTGVLYVVQRMASLSALFVLLALLAYLWLRQSLRDGHRRQSLTAAAVLALSWLAAFYAKESALLLPVFCLSLEIIVFGETRPGRRHMIAFILFGLMMLLPVSVFLAMNGWGVFEQPYRYRNFTAGERLLTEARVLWDYLYWLVVPDVDRMGLHHDDIALSRGLLDPPTTLLALLGLAAMALVAWLQRRSARWVPGGVLFFFGGHLMESTIVPLEIAYEHRNYLPSYGIILLLGLLVYRTLAHRPGWLAALGVLTALSLSSMTHSRATLWGDSLVHQLREASNHPHSPRANYHAGRIFWQAMHQPGADRENLRQQAGRYFYAAMRADACNLSGGLALLATEADVMAIKGEIIPLLNSRIERCAISRHDADLLSFLILCTASGMCAADRDKLIDLAGRFEASERMVAQGRQLLLAARAAKAARGDSKIILDAGSKASLAGD
jgi:hypothetical protein